MTEYRYNVFGTVVLVTHLDGRWQAFYPGSDGKRRPADFIVSPDVEQDELAEYLADLFHEHATPRRGDVIRLA
jgi:hypothetical protein